VAKVQISHLSQMYLSLILTNKYCLVRLCSLINDSGKGFQGAIKSHLLEGRHVWLRNVRMIEIGREQHSHLDSSSYEMIEEV
jgi:hypothetical protein